jgi:hypothetical protein
MFLMPPHNRKVLLCVAQRLTSGRVSSVDASCDILPGVAGILPVFDEIAGRSAFFIQKCLSSDSHTIRSVANMAVFSLRLRLTKFSARSQCFYLLLALRFDAV